MKRDDDPFTEEDEAALRRWERQADLADRVIERDYAELAGKEGAWVAFRDGKLLAKGPDVDQVMRAVRSLGWDREEIHLRYLIGKDVIFIPTNFGTDPPDWRIRPGETD